MLRRLDRFGLDTFPCPFVVLVNTCGIGRILDERCAWCWWDPEVQRLGDGVKERLVCV